MFPIRKTQFIEGINFPQEGINFPQDVNNLLTASIEREKDIDSKLQPLFKVETTTPVVAAKKKSETDRTRVKLRTPKNFD